MTSPVGGKPKQTNDKYNDVYARGSSFGSDLRTEADVRRLLLSKPPSGFQKFLGGIAAGFDAFVKDLASVFRGNGGGRYEVLKVAVDERFQTEINGVTEAVDRAQKAIDDANTALVEQGKLTEQQKTDLQTAKTDLDKAKQDVKNALTDLSTLQDEAGRIRDSLAGKVDTSKFNTELGKKADKEAYNKEIAKWEKALKERLTAQDLTTLKNNLSDAVARVEKAEEAIGSLEGLYPVDGAGSLVVVKPDTLEPYWWLERPDKPVWNFGDKPSGVTWAQGATLGDKQWVHWFPKRFVRVTPGVDYYWSFWIKVNKPSALTVILRASDDVKDKHIPLEKGSLKLDDNPDASLWSNFQWGTGVKVKTANKWVKCSGTFRFRKDVKWVYLCTFEWNRGDNKGVSQAVGDLEIHPLLTDPSDVQKAINDANQTITETISTNKKAAEKSVNEATEKITALQKGIPLGGSLIAYDDRPGHEREPLWWQAAPGGMSPDYPKKFPNWSFPDGHQWRTGNPQGKKVTHNCPDKLIKVQPGVDYTFKFWTQATGEGSVLFIEFRNQDGHKCVKSGGLNANGEAKASEYPVNGLRVPKAKRQWVTKTLRFTEDTREVKLCGFYFNHSNGKETNQWIAGLECYPSTVDQAFVDKMQNEAILANSNAIGTNVKNIDLLKTVAENQEKWNQAQKVINDKNSAINKAQKLVNDENKRWSAGATNALEALGKITGYTNLGSSCVPLIPGTTTPAWTTAAANPKSGYPYRVSNTKSVSEKAVVAIDPSIEYEFTIRVSGSSRSGYAYINMCDEKGQAVYPSTKQVESSTGDVLGVFNRVEFSTDTYIRIYTFRLKFLDSVKYLRISGFEVENSALNIYDIRFAPYFVPQAEVDRAQNAAIGAVSKAQKVEEDANEKFKKQQIQINDFGAKIDAAQNKSLQIHQDTLELLDIRTPKSYYLDAAKKQSGSNNWFTWSESKVGSERVLTLVALGTWTGKLQFTSNWSNGAADNWIVDVKNDPNHRGFKFRGGAAHITRRGYAITVYPTCLNRKFSLKRVNKYAVEYADDPGNLRRKGGAYGRLLFRGPVKANYSVNVYPTKDLDAEDGKRFVKAGEILQGEYIEAPLNKHVVFTEVDTSTAFANGMDTTKPKVNGYIDVSGIYGVDSGPGNMSSDWGSSGSSFLSS